jgi:hypothetical protein
MTSLSRSIRIHLCWTTLPVFDRLRSTRIKLNPDKCVFGFSARKLLGFLVSHWGIKGNPEKIKAIKVMWPPARIMDVQKLTG